MLALMSKLTGPNTTQAVIRAGPSERRQAGRFGELTSIEDFSM